MFAEAKNEYGFGYQYFSTIMAWREDAKAPKNLAEFFDTKAFPGKRCLPDYPHYLPAVRAVRRRACRPTSCSRSMSTLAFKKLNEDQEGRRGLVEGGRPAAAAPQGQRGAVRDLLVGPRRRRSGHRLNFAGGSPICRASPSPRAAKPEDKAAAYRLFHEMSLAENQAKAAQVISYTGPSPDLEALLPKDKLGEFPTSKQNKAVQYFENAEWWADNGEAVNEKWKAFKLSLWNGRCADKASPSSHRFWC